jgi:hypothetical protein
MKIIHFISGLSCSHFNLPTPLPTEDLPEHNQPETNDISLPYELLNDDQRLIVDTIITASTNASNPDSQNQPHIYYLDGPGGTGKTTVYNTIISMLSSRNIKVSIRQQPFQQLQPPPPNLLANPSSHIQDILTYKVITGTCLQDSKELTKDILLAFTTTTQNSITKHILTLSGTSYCMDRNCCHTAHERMHSAQPIQTASSDLGYKHLQRHPKVRTGKPLTCHHRHHY